MRTVFALLLMAAAHAPAQTTTPPPSTAPPAPAPIATPITQTSNAPIATTTVNTSALPGITLGVGPAWNRGSANALAVDVTLGIRLGATSNVYSWTNVTTPVARPSSQPVLSTVTTGAAWVVAQNKTGSVSLLLIGQAGFSSSTMGTSPAFTGSVAAAFRLGKSNIYAMPYFKAANPSLSTAGTLASFTIQPGIQFTYGFGK